MFNIRYILFIVFSLAIMLFSGCKEQTEKSHTGHQAGHVQYTCPMHPQIIRNAPGKCPICGMDLVKKDATATKHTDITLNILLQPTNQYVISSVPVTTATYRHESMEIEAVGYTTYNSSTIGIIAARVSGRIEKLYIKYRYQPVTKGQRIMDIYSPELQTAQENLLFVIKNDASNKNLINAARQRLLLLGVSDEQLARIISRRNIEPVISVYSNYSGHIHEASANEQMQANEMVAMEQPIGQSTPALNIKEGMYVQKGQMVFTVYDPKQLWGILSIYQSDQPYVKKGDIVQLIPEGSQAGSFKAKISYVEPALRPGTKTATARINIDNTDGRLRVGSQLKAIIIAGPHTGWWLPKEAVLSLGINKVVFVKKSNGFVVQKITTGHVHPHWVQVVEGLDASDSVAANAQFLMDSENFIKVNSQ